MIIRLREAKGIQKDFQKSLMAFIKVPKINKAKDKVKEQ